VREGPPLDNWDGDIPLNRLQRPQELAGISRQDFYRQPWRGYTAGWLLVYTLITDESFSAAWDSVLDVIREPMTEAAAKQGTEKAIGELNQEQLWGRMQAVAVGNQDVVLSIAYQPPKFTLPRSQVVDDVIESKLRRFARYARGR
jgi:hypothetical protein